MTGDRWISEVKQAAGQVELARERLAVSIVNARNNGHSLRAIATAAGISHTEVARIVADA